MKGINRAVIFDMDGVLVDNRDLHIEAFRIWGQRNGKSIDEHILLSMFGMGNSDILPKITGEKIAENDIERYGEEKEIIYREIAERKIQPLPGLPEFLEGLRKRQIPMAVGSSGMRRNVNMVLSRLRIGGYFSAIVDGDQLSHAKPNPEVYLKCAAALGMKPENCIVCEDAPAGIEAARRAGMKVIAIASTLPKEKHTDYDILVDDFRELSDIDGIII